MIPHRICHPLGTTMIHIAMLYIERTILDLRICWKSFQIFIYS